MADEIEHLWEMVGDPSFGRLVGDRYLVVVHGGVGITGDPTYRCYAIVDLQTGESDIYQDLIYNPVDMAVTGPDTVLVLGRNTAGNAGTALTEITASTGVVYKYTVTPTPLPTASLAFDSTRNSAFLSFSSTVTGPLRRFDLTVGMLVDQTSSGTSYRGIVFYDPLRDEVVNLDGTTVTRFNPDDLTDISTHSTNISIPNTVRTYAQQGDEVIFVNGTHAYKFKNSTLTTEQGSLEFNTSSSGTINLGSDGVVYGSMHTTNTAFAIPPNLSRARTIPLTSRGRRGTAIPVGNKVYIPAGTRP